MRRGREGQEPGWETEPWGEEEFPRVGRTKLQQRVKFSRDMRGMERFPCQELCQPWGC